MQNLDLKMATPAVIGLFAIAVAVVITIVVLGSRNKRKRCSEKVEAVVVDIAVLGYASEHDDMETRNKFPSVPDNLEHELLAPVYEFKVNGQIGHIKGTYSSLTAPKLGDKMTIMVNPHNLQDYYEVGGKKEPVWILITISAIMVGVFVVMAVQMAMELI